MSETADWLPVHGLVAVRARPPIVTIVALLGLTLLTGPASQTRPDPPEHVLPWPGATAHADAQPEGPQGSSDGLGDVVSPPAFADARPWNHGGMVMGLTTMPATHDRIARNALTDLLSGLFDVVRSLRV